MSGWEEYKKSLNVFRPYIMRDQFNRMLNFHITYIDNDRTKPYLALGKADYYRAYWNRPERIDPPTQFFQQLRYLPLPRSKPDLDLALDGAALDCAADIDKWIRSAQGAIKVWMSIQVRYEAVNPAAPNAHPPFTFYLSYTGKRFFLRTGVINS